MEILADKLEQEARVCRDCRKRSQWSAAAGRVAERSFARLVALLSPRIERLTRSYGLRDLADDARQACAIGIHRALDSYQPDRARFTTHVTWLMRGELQSLRHRVRLDQRQGARSAGIRTIPLHDRKGAVLEVADEPSLASAERGARDALTRRNLSRLLDRTGQPAEERGLIHAHIFDQPPPAAFAGHSNEQRRQIVRRNLRHCARVAQDVRIAP